MPYWRLSSFYFFYFALLGCIAPFWALFLSDRGFTPLEIGELMGLFGLVRMIAPNVWGALGDYTGKRMPLLRIGCGVCFVVFSNIYWVDDFFSMACIMVGYGFFWAAVLPQFEVVTLNYLRDRTDDYSKIRIWGSIGFVVVVLLLGWVFDYLSVSYLPAFMLAMLLAIFICSLCVRGIDQMKHGEESEGFLVLLWRPQVLAFLVAAFLIQFSHGAYYTFFSLFLEAQGYSKTMIGFLWALGVMAEVLVFLVVHKLFKHVGYKSVLIASLFLAALRWYFTAHFSDVLWMLMLLQLTHAATFGTMHAVSMHYVHKYFNGPHQGQGQAFFASFTYGAGGALGTYISGLVWQQDLGVTMFELAGLSALVGMVIALIWVKK
ncbi:MFS transporter [Bermanella sp. 47_1433_sub80_T6]|nr:MFS transporter [Bermanella sp. 47_1433_sub80_T6]